MVEFLPIDVHRNRGDPCKVSLVGEVLKLSSSQSESFTLLIASCDELAE